MNYKLLNVNSFIEGISFFQGIFTLDDGLGKIASMQCHGEISYSHFAHRLCTAAHMERIMVCLYASIRKGLPIMHEGRPIYL